MNSHVHLPNMKRFLIIQTAFIGDVVLATAVAEKLHHFYPAATIDFLLRKGNEGLLQSHPFIHQVLIWDKTTAKQRNLLRILKLVRSQHYTHVINLHRFATSGLITALSGASQTIGFDMNPLSFFFSKKYPHIISVPYSENPVHEVQRNQSLIAALTDNQPARPKLYPTEQDYQAVSSLKAKPFICFAPSSVWFTKQFPEEKWMMLANAIPEHFRIYLLGGKGDISIAEKIKTGTTHPDVVVLCGQLSLLQSAALMKDAKMNYANDSAPQHFASAMNAPITGIFCSTVPAFGFGPLSEVQQVIETEERLPCKPCGLHGHKSCPAGHFKCARDIRENQLLWWM